MEWRGLAAIIEKLLRQTPPNYRQYPMIPHIPSGGNREGFPPPGWDCSLSLVCAPGPNMLDTRSSTPSRHPNLFINEVGPY
ncbi:hypothetical protein ES708_14989 [subsurface metagenome]